MTNFDHVVDARVRSVLMGDLSEDAICYALTKSRAAVEADQFNPDVSYRVLNARELAIGDAEYCWNDEGDPFGAVECLQQFWSV